MPREEPSRAGMTREALEAGLPFRIDEFMVRAAVRADIDRRAAWPSYPPPYGIFDARSKKWDAERRERNWIGMRDHSPNDIFLACEGLGCDLLGWFVLCDIDWASCFVGNMSIRLHPEHCDCGIGTGLATGIFSWCHARGLERIRLDVLSTNQRAARCYEKAGLKKTGEFQRDGATFWWMESIAARRG